MIPKQPLQAILALLFVLHSGTALSGQILSNGTGGGDWSDGATWQGGTPPANTNFTIQGGDVVTATGVDFTISQNPNINGTLTIGAGSNMTVGRLAGDGNGTVNVNNAAILQADRYATGINMIINTGGYFYLTSLGNPASITTVNTGGVWEADSNAAFNGEENLFGGTIIQNNATVRGIGNWTSGTVITNGGTVTSNTEAGLFVSQMTTPAHVLQVSDQDTATTFTFGNSFLDSFTGGTLRFGVYSAATNDSDRIASTGIDLDIPVDTIVEFDDQVALPGVAADYLGSSYQLFDDPNSFDDIAPTIAASVWTIGGLDYNVSFTDNLAVDGTLTVSDLSVIPEPTVAVGILGLVGFLVAWTRRRSSKG